MKKDLSDVLDQKKKENKPNSEYANVDSKDLTTQLKYSRVIRYQSDTKDRKWLAKWAAWAVSIWLGIVLLILFLNPFLHLAESVLITLLTTTTLNVLGLTFIVLRGHFYTNYYQNKK